MNITKSEKLFKAAQAVIPGGVNSPARAFRAVGGQPLFIDHAEGAFLWDVDGNRYIDYVLSWGPLILGHAHPKVVAAIQKAATRGTSYGAPTAIETELAELVCELIPSAEQVRFVNSGTEATMSVLRLARAYTGRNKIIKLQGNYHGHADFLLVQAGSGVATLGLPDSPGVPPGATKDTLTAPYNNLEAIEILFNQFNEDIAAIILEPVAGNMGLIPPVDGYLAGLRRLCTQHGTLLIFDEVMTGFRVALGGAQEYFGITPDLTALGKVIGGGLPVGAYAGRKEIMQIVAPAGPMYQAGTLSGNPLAMTAGLMTLKGLAEPGVFENLVESTTQLCEGISAAAEAAGVSLYPTQAGAMFCFFFTDTPVVDWETASKSDVEQFAKFFQAMLERGVYFPPSQFESWFLSTAHTEEAIVATIQAAQTAFREIA
ncbi:MAG: glutamate-1-semialdehyde 2,1-aminomutase [Anaerolineaceae bacterium]|nr:glutamate-1-semialdehyde 2,1-aminomutase [Anaerolineaceae bacterium]MCB9099568.1 glutamate-1-semialdehyde 2,1-aminomutase [Anaerolineales bacterium]